MIGKLVKQKIFGEFFSDGGEEEDTVYRYGIVLSEVEEFDVHYYMVLWQPTPLFPVGNLQNRRPYTCLANKKSLVLAYEDEKS